MSEIVSESVANQQQHGNSVFPFVYVCQDDVLSLEQAGDWVASHRDQLLKEANQHGAVLLRGFPVRDAQGFDTLVRSLDIPNFPYEKSLSNAVRVNRTERVFSANEAPPDVQIFFHHEMAQTPLFPRWILFSCEVAASKGGATPICRSDVLLERLREACPQFVKQCEKLGLRYTNVMPDQDDAKSGMGRSWRSTLGVDSKEAAETRLQTLGYSWEWLENDCLKATTPPLPAVVNTDDGRQVFFNQLIAAFCGWQDERNDPSQAIRHGDGSPLNTDAVMTAAKIADEITFYLQWQVGDVVLIDNTIVMHARQPFVGKRKVVASLAEMQTQQFTPIA